MEVEVAPGTGEQKKGSSGTFPLTLNAANAFINPVAPQDTKKPTSSSPSTPLAFDQASLQKGLSQPPSVQATDLGIFGNKKCLRPNATPGENTVIHVAEATGTPQSKRIQDLFPGKTEANSLEDMVSKLLGVVKAGFPLATKKANIKQNSVDVKTAADIMVLTGAIYDQYMYKDARRNFNMPGSLSTPSPKGRSIIFKGRETEDELDVVVEELDMPSQQQQQKRSKNPILRV
ncbi:uncharacterized protein MELLADRAFT_65887 [Melampsora larici-populina 98AG31]|uniref:Uncharacterized protein n=1 Tax=Melampsora larici-populina (strain 98AG31 / pathotype 3-4-7) TaxID=747676 RepID=F4RX33_MELLP|nr:uncharacterized protein MELLADRAFT_65887 [Melampsora larici-populina 98AG31]EGG02892.1 hypothetical protein MELLADRAFT_65887 [Melampsora larici-populina 98AG31]